MSEYVLCQHIKTFVLFSIYYIIDQMRRSIPLYKGLVQAAKRIYLGIFWIKYR